MESQHKQTMKAAFVTSLPIIFGYIPTGFIFGFMLVSKGYSHWLALLMSMIIYAGAGQYISVTLLATGAGYVDIALTVFLINCKHLFYGLSLIEPFKKMGMLKPYMIFSLTDETYAVLTNTKPSEDVDPKKYMFYVALFDQMAWVTGSFLGAIFGKITNWNTAGMDFAMTALFLVILIEQLKTYKTKMPFLIGTFSAIAVLIVDQTKILLFGTTISVILLIIFRKKIDNNVIR